MSEVSDDGYRDFFPGLLEEHLEEGLSFESFVGVVRCDLDVLKDWLKKYPEFKAACTYGDAKGRMMLEKLGISGVKGEIRGFQFGLYKAIMEHRGYIKKEEESKNPANHTVLIIPANERNAPRIKESKVIGVLSSPVTEDDGESD